MKGKNLIMCGLCACIGFIGGEVRAYHKVLNELRTMERPKVTYSYTHEDGSLFKSLRREPRDARDLSNCQFGRC